MKSVFTVVVALVLTACSGTSPEKHAVAQYNQAVQQAVMKQFGSGEKYAGQHCTVTAERRADGGYNVMRTEGDEPLCLAAWHSVSSAQRLPLPPQQAAKTAIFLFAPLKPAPHAAATGAG
ncbi:cell envelope integrity TolA C-terminal domain-containing protein [Pantoea sp. A4]|uniref:cell envelope integrity TolA C-terminal domain-containing protein n=1 Tax=Pantoea sp. A4 TaxID=1225184 RepID=UPI000374E840|nr:cell envelope integrity TolA C-terminal domain-containing protein [Pantoea sp. A4]